MDAILALMNAVFLAFIVSTMFHVGLITTLEHLVGVVRDVRWLAGAIVASLVLVPLSGWLVAEAFPLEGAAFVALILVASSPGAPFSVALTGIQGGDLVAGRATMAILAVVGSGSDGAPGQRRAPGVQPQCRTGTAHRHGLVHRRGRGHPGRDRCVRDPARHAARCGGSPLEADGGSRKGRDVMP